MQQQYWLIVLGHVGEPTLGLFWRGFCRRSTSFYGSCREGAYPSMTAPCARGIVWGRPADVLLAPGVFNPGTWHWRSLDLMLTQAHSLDSKCLRALDMGRSLLCPVSNFLVMSLPACNIYR